MLVNLFLVGSQKAGTSSLHDYIKDYIPSVFMAPSKETFYFVNDRFWSDLKSNNFDYYHHTFFKDAPASARYIGESSTHYTMCPMEPSIAPRIKLYNEQAKFLYIVRNPVDRAVSNYWHFVGLSAEGRSMTDAFAGNPQYAKTGDYLFQIKPYFDCFPASNIRIANFEDLVNRPLSLIKAIAEWLGDHEVNTLSAITPFWRRERATKFQLSSNSLLSQLKYSPFWRYKLRRYIPSPIRALGKHYAVKDVDANSDDLKLEEMRARDQISKTLNPLWENFISDPHIKKTMLKCS
jgi:hypothetical protein